jgi:hypothetical protein
VKRYLLLLVAAALTGCSSAPEPKKKAEAAPPPPLAVVKDHSAAMPPEGLKGSEVIANHILGRQEMPGGTLGNYEEKAKKYQQFIIDVDDNQKAAFLLLDFKKTLKDPDYIDYMGGYFGNDGTQNVYVFAKLHYLAGVVGLPKADADPIARVLASHLH